MWWRACGLGILAVVVGCGGGGGTPSATGPAPVPVETVIVAAEDVDVAVAAVGTLAAEQTVELKPKRPGHVREVRLTEGAKVAAGDILVVLDQTEVLARLDQATAAKRDAEVRLGNARRREGRLGALVAEGIAARQDYDDVRAELESAAAAVGVAEANLTLARAQIAETEMRAPFAGIVGRRRLDIGAYVKDGEPIVAIVDADPIDIIFTVPERHLVQLHGGQVIRAAVVSHAARTFEGTVTFVDPQVDPVNRVVTVKAVIPNADGALRPGQFANVTLDLERHEGAAVVPEEALVPSGDHVFVYVVDGESATARDVRTGVRLPGRVEIVDGLTPGAVIVRTGHEKLKPGAPATVKVVQAAPAATGG